MFMNSFTRVIQQSYGSFKIKDFTDRNFKPAMFHSLLKELVKKSGGIISLDQAGTSFENRSIYLLRAGTGTTKVLLWSQMHGDESTATMAIADILNYFILNRDTEEAGTLLSSLSLYFVPMLNPDGAERFQRRTAQNIDMNRDALALVTPEARLLKQLQNELKPEFGFNLHDQELSTVSQTQELTAIALLAPAFNAEKSDNEVRTKAKQLGALFTSTMQEIIPGKMARYDDSFEPRAFGDNVQKWGTSTLLVESGHSLNDAQKHFIRSLNVIGILSCFQAITNGTYKKTDVLLYDQLPFNGKRAYDIVIRNIRIDYGGNKTATADLGISYQVDTHSDPTPKLVDLGDLHTFMGLKEIDGKEKLIPSALLILGSAFELERLV
jgi:hypothetical protein